MIWWLVWALIQTIVLHRLQLTWETAFIDSFVSNTLLALACFISFLLYRYYQPGKTNKMYRVVFAIVITVLFLNGSRWLLRYILVHDDEYLVFLEASSPVRFIVSLLIISFVTLLNWLWGTLEEQKEQQNRKAEAEQLVKEAELVKLRQQLQPHFLFNSLNSISALAGAKPDEARKMIQQLSDFLRGTLKKDEQQTVPLQEELEHLNLYLEIEKVRFGHRLNVEIVAGDNSVAAKLPPLLLQPIVENAIKFGLYGTIDAITVSIAARVENMHLLVEVKNPFDEATQNVKQGTGFGLSSIQRRLFLLYSRNDLISTEKNGNEFITRLKIPQLK